LAPDGRSTRAGMAGDPVIDGSGGGGAASTGGGAGAIIGDGAGVEAGVAAGVEAADATSAPSVPAAAASLALGATPSAGCARSAAAAVRNARKTRSSVAELRAAAALPGAGLARAGRTVRFTTPHALHVHSSDRLARTLRKGRNEMDQEFRQVTHNTPTLLRRVLERCHCAFTRRGHERNQCHENVADYRRYGVRVQQTARRQQKTYCSKTVATIPDGERTP
jgi:hypothetical protein